ncbi:hypothetical protein NliqN6_0372 [Naganishia liquefaciens]|uniref:Aminotransferase class V domain-containing protein n=1 Tax=Naganishia liquefaciens TaxID=104408 RepID=A0A8H3TP57_9TREE|nr:hypothetical protein NliqN6_0372 [Naganishia liquefaciens]
MPKPLNIAQEVRPHFPAVTDDFIFGDNAGGSQILRESVDAISDYLLTSNVQMGGGYMHSVEAAKRVEKGKEAAAVLTNVEGGPSQIVIGSSTTQLASNLGHACALAGKTHGLFELNDEIIISAAEHEANVGPWVRLAKELNLTIKYWLPSPLPNSESPFAIGLNPADLEPLLSANTRLVAFTAVSNLLGHRTPVKDVVEIVKSKTGARAMTVVDCVAYAPHGHINMQEWGCDAVLFSFYKLFGPHLSCLALAPWSPLATKSHSLGHYFHPQAVSYKLAPGGAPYELQVGCYPILPYLLSLGDGEGGTASEKQLAIAFERIRVHERLLSERMLAYLLSKEAKVKGVQVVGPHSSEDRVPTISFVVVERASQHGNRVIYKKRMTSKDVVSKFDEGQKIGIKYGHFYSTKVMPCLPLDTSIIPDNLVFDKSNAWQPVAEDDGVVRISLVHYNTLEEVDEIIEHIRNVLSEL